MSESEVLPMPSVKTISTFTLLSTTVMWNMAYGATHMFSIPAGTVPEALSAFQKQSGVGVVAKGRDFQNVRVSAIHGMMDDREALQKLLAGTPLQVKAPGNGSTLIVSKKPDAKLVQQGVNDVEGLFVTGHRRSQSEKRNSNIIMDTVAYDPFENLGGVSSVAQSLIQLPGVTGITDGDEPRYVSIRGISPELNHTTMDGITMATVGENGGSGSRKVNLQNVPSEMTSRTNIYKSFTAEQEGDAIGGDIDMVPMSAFDHKGLYKFIDAYGIWSSKRGGVGANGLKGYDPHMGQGAKGTFSDTFGKNKQFGIVLSMRYQHRVRNTTKQWQNYAYEGTDGKYQTNATKLNDWTGRIKPSTFSVGEYANAVTNLGGSGRLEWKPNRNMYMSLMGWSYTRWEHSVMDSEDNVLVNETPGTLGNDATQHGYKNNIKRRQDQWHRQNSGIIGHFDWHQGKHHLIARAGYTMESYNNYEPYLGVITTKLSGVVDGYNGYPNSDDMYNFDYQSKPNIDKIAHWLLNPGYINQTWEQSWQHVPTARLDYDWNTGEHDRGFGMATGFEWREMTMSYQKERLDYAIGNNVTFDKNNLIFSDRTPWLSNFPKTFIGLDGYSFPWSSLTVDGKKSAYDSRSADYKYREDIYDGYLSLHYALKHTVFIAGVRVDGTSYTGWTPLVDNAAGTASSDYVKHPGGYNRPLPSFDVVHHFAQGFNLHASYSQTIGRAAPGQIAQARNENCGDANDTGGTSCSISQGNPNLKPRLSNNFDISVDKWFNRGNGLFSVAFFSKWIKNDILTSRSIYEQDGSTYQISTPMNSKSADVKGVEVNMFNRNMHLFSQIIDAQANVTWMQGHESYSGTIGASSTPVVFKVNKMLYQPQFIANGMLTWHIPQIKGALRATVNYSGKYYTSFGTRPAFSSGFDKFMTFNLGFWHEVYPGITLKYEVMNLANYQPTYLTGDHLQFAHERDNYGRAVYFHVIFH
ncbi:MAG: TonB-dependent receptor [Acetobacter orientalis]|uniref:TonB-dependent receptor n=1 Tax=Acetobacter orientalis TaxID=146474 RepID=UPI0039ECB1E3